MVWPGLPAIGGRPDRRPRRAVGVLAAVAFVVCLVAVGIAFLGGQSLLGPHGISLGHPGAVRAVFGAALYLTVVGVLGVGLGFLLRSTAGAIATLIAVLAAAAVALCRRDA